jgi:YGGT family
LSGDSSGEEGDVMAIDKVDQTVVTSEPTVTAGQETAPTATSQETVQTDTRHITRTGPGGSEMTRRIIALLFGLIQIVIGLRIVLLLLDARTGNALVSGVLDVSKIFVAPFEGVLNTNALSSGGSTLDVAAVVAFVGWTILELIVLWAVGIFRREPA